MFEFHGWAVVRHHTHDIDPAEQRACWARVLEHIEALNAPVGTISTATHNGMEVVRVDGQHNHRRAWPIDLFRTIGRLAPGSYGVLYVQDDEDPRHGGDFRVWVLRRGSLSEEADRLLSPFVPRCEDPYDPRAE